ncbi:Abp1 [Cyberlindnera jadinii]|uniref:Amine oxidase n=1 Tax=Cyberlindnera jadinii (strain ATCC 18201 / CBS 1600 / BCRC 20928 / JCM 3617 / NBRC 0987 / NRRL Y-1542) TaxID=983966 RepID=A0A0H5CEK0_CYBJN|nr:Abp1 [Cyberlindnera jadinii]
MLWKHFTAALSLASLASAYLNPRQARSEYKNRFLYKRYPELLEKREVACGASTPGDAVPSKINIWADLSDDEAQVVYDLLKDTFNLTASVNATMYDNYVTWIETLRPNKTDAIAYLDNDGPVPERWARATVFLGTDEYVSDEFPDGYWQELQVGPLNTNGSTPEISELEYIYTKSKVSFAKGYKDDLKWAAAEEIYAAEILSDTMLPVLVDLVGEDIKTYGEENSTVECWATDPFQIDDDGTVTDWATIFLNYHDAGDVTPTGVFLQIVMTGRNVEDYYISQWVYNNIVYNSSDEFREAWESDDFVKLPKIDTTNLNTTETFVYIGQQGTTRELDEKLAPIAIEPEGRRWKYSESERYFTWMDWEFYVAWNRDNGLALYDVKFKGERIAFEIGLQEAIAEYSGDDPFQAHTTYFDRSYGFGNEAFGLVPGFDCPYNAEFFNVTWHSNGDNNYHNNSYCAFEFSEDYPFVRHTASEYITVSKNPTFNLRSITTIGNYDYNFLYKFFLDGTFEVSVRAAGYIQGAYYNPETGDPFGYKINEVLSGSFHDHVINFKADFDIAGTANRLAKVELEAVNHTYPWAPDKVFSTKQKRRSVIANETYLNWADAGAILLIESAEQNNTWGNPRAYRAVFPGGDARRIAQNTHTIINNAHWAEKDMAITVQKDTEFTSSHVFCSQDLEDPIINFDNFVDGESIDGEDLVYWFNLALHHLPNTQDIPNTIYSTAQSSIIFTPFNYFDTEQSRDTLQQMYYTYEDATWDFNGVSVSPECLFGIEPLNFDAVNYDGMQISKDTTNIPST